MTHRERSTTGAAPTVSSRSSERSRNGTATNWESLERELPVFIRRELLREAERIGYLTPERIHEIRSSARESNIGTDLQRLLQPQIRDELPSYAAFESGSFLDDKLDPRQQTAVRRALATPDIFLLRGESGTGKTRTLVEIVRRTVQQGLTVLISAPSVYGIDQLVKLLGSTEHCCVRLPNPDEIADDLPSDVRDALPDAHRQWTTTTVLPELAASLHAAEARCNQLNLLHETLTSIQEQPRRREMLMQQRRAIAEATASIETTIAQAAQTPGTPLQAALQAIDQRRAETEARLAAGLTELAAKQLELTAAQEKIEATIAELDELVKAKQGYRLWSGQFWKGVLRSNLDHEGASLREQLKGIVAESAKLHERAKELEAERARSAAEALTEAEQARSEARTQEAARLAAELATLDQTEQDLNERFAAFSQNTREAGLPPPSEPSSTALQECFDTLTRALQAARERCDHLRAWQTHVTADAALLAERRLREAAVVAGTPSAIAADTLFAQRVFDLLVVEDCHDLCEADLERLMEHAGRWVLSAEPYRGQVVEPRSSGRNGNGGQPRRPGIDVFRRLWNNLHYEPWLREGDRLCCRLKPLRPEERSRLESEPCADNPAVELRIWTPAEGDPCLAEVLFPANMSAIEAKNFLYRELGEVPIHSGGLAAWWIDTPGQLSCCFGPARPQGAETRSLPFDEGVREILIDSGSGNRFECGWQTCAVDFDRSRGWTREKAAAWLDPYLRHQHNTRTMRLTQSHRRRPELSAWIAEVFCPTLAAPTLTKTDGAAVVDFYAVVGDENGRRKPRANPPGDEARPGGAGLEIALHDPRSRERLAPDLLAQLPKQGYVNYPEAQAMMRRLEILLADTSQTIAVTAVTHAQVELIHLLAERLPAVAKAGSRLRITEPSALVQQEFDVVLVGLVRSHLTRAAAYGDDPYRASTAIGRARKRLLLFGDPGTLARRRQWETALEHFDETAAATELLWVSALHEYILGKGRYPHLFRSHEGTRV